MAVCPPAIENSGQTSRWSALSAAYLRLGSSRCARLGGLHCCHDKRNKYRNDIPGFVFILPLAFETEGNHTKDLDKLLHGLAKMRAAADGLEGVELKQRTSMWTEFWLNQFSIVHARYLARCVLHVRRCARARRARLSPGRLSWTSAAASLTMPPLPPPPPPQLPLPGTASAAALAPARCGTTYFSVIKAHLPPKTWGYYAMCAGASRKRRVTYKHRQRPPS
jgi:hypothetical protein